MDNYGAMIIMNFLKYLLIPISFLAAASVYSAEPATPVPPPPPHRHHGEMKGPPPFDPALCRDKAVGATVEIKTPDGRPLKGKCQLVFLPELPENPPPPASPRP